MTRQVPCKPFPASDLLNKAPRERAVRERMEMKDAKAFSVDFMEAVLAGWRSMFNPHSSRRRLRSAVPLASSPVSSSDASAALRAVPALHCSAPAQHGLGHSHAIGGGGDDAAGIAGAFSGGVEVLDACADE